MLRMILFLFLEIS